MDTIVITFQSLSGLSLGSLDNASSPTQGAISCFNPFQGCRWVLWNLRWFCHSKKETVSIPFRAVAGFFVNRNAEGFCRFSRFNPFQGCRWVLCHPHRRHCTTSIFGFQSLSGLSLGSLFILYWKGGFSDTTSFNPFQGCRWVLWRSLRPCESLVIPTVSIPFRAVAGFFEKIGDSMNYAEMNVSIPFRAVAGFFAIGVERGKQARVRFNPFQGCRWVLCPSIYLW